MTERQVLSVSQLNRTAKDLLESLPPLWVAGELSNIARPSSGHLYFTLKDASAQVRCALFRTRAQAVRVPLNHGLQVLVRAQVSLYEGRGDYQLIVDYLEPAGAGDLHRQIEALKARLAAEGLFDPARKRPLPSWPRRVGLITSAGGAAVADMLRVLRERWPLLEVDIYPTLVQGEAAPAAIAAAIALAETLDRCDVLIVGRGGGSLEDLMAFNTETVARAIANCTIPVVSAVGHETDVTIADFCADARAPTPTAAAALVTPDGSEVLRRLARLERYLVDLWGRRVRSSRTQLGHLTARLRDPSSGLRQRAQALDRLELRLARAQRMHVMQQRQHLDTLARRLASADPRARTARAGARVAECERRLTAAFRRGLRERGVRLAQTSARLASVSPLNVLARGYAIASDEQGRVLRAADQAPPGTAITLRLHRGQLSARVERAIDEAAP